MASPLDLFIAGAWLSGTGDEETVVVDPADESPVATLRHASDADIEAALDAAASTLPEWWALGADERAAILRRAADLIEERAEELAVVLTTEQGKPLGEAVGELRRAAETIRWYGNEAPRLVSHVDSDLETDPGLRRILAPEPVGVVAALTAWNFPAVLPARKLGPALAAGCTVILKAAEETPGTALGLARAFADAGLPPGVLNVVFGEPAQISQRLLASPIVRKLSFTGSVAVGKQLAAAASQNLVRCTLELGGHAPMIVLPDADLDQAVEAASAFKWRNAGQVCLAPSRFYVHRSIIDGFIDRFTAKARRLKIGHGLEPGVEMGPLNNPRRLAAMEGFVRDAVDRGATLIEGGKRLGEKGFFFPPTILADTPEEAEVMNLEPFGPIAPFADFVDVEEVLKRANRLPYGLAAYVFTGSEETARFMAARLEAGTVGINCFRPAPTDAPLGGVKDSGYGYEGGREGLEAFVHYKLVNEMGVAAS